MACEIPGRITDHLEICFVIDEDSFSLNKAKREFFATYTVKFAEVNVLCSFWFRTGISICRSVRV